MKKTIACLAFCLVVGIASHAQGGLLNTATKAASAAGFDVSKLTSGIMGKLVPSLSLTNDQKPKVTDAISSFLGAKSKILPLQQSDPASYATKQSGLFSSLKSKLAGMLLQNQMNKFLGLKPKTNDPTNVLSNLFY
ncbi:MAG: hypothetical protein J0I41_14450 [Filimonas sp.]|nr:hypothetical protein [Filimonas sp.]